jgi:phytoene desaturase
MSLFVIYFGTKIKYNHLPHHSIILGKTYKELLSDIFKNYKLSDDFSLYLHRPTATDDSVAPPGNDCFYVLSPVPNLKSGINWNEIGEKYKNLILDYLEKKYMPGLRKNIVTEFYITPEYYLNKLNSHLGTAFAIEPLLFQSAWMRPHNESEDIKNLFFVGAGTHPGAGLPGVISSAKIVENLIRNIK